MLTSHFDGTSSLCQDPHLNRFFQQCQKRELDLSLPPTSNFLNCLKVRESPSSISCDRDRNQLLPSARQSHACQTTFDPLPSVWCVFFLHLYLPLVLPSSSPSPLLLFLLLACLSHPSPGSSEHGEDPSDHPLPASALQPAVQGPDSERQWWGHHCHHEVGCGTAVCNEKKMLFCQGGAEWIAHSL